MDADWFEDPLGRFDGRFFDGQQWTDQVSTGGRLETDPNFPEPAAVTQVDTGGPKRATTTAESPVRTVAVLDESVMGPPSGPSGLERSSRVIAFAGLAVLAVLLTVFVVQRLGERADDSLDTTAEARVEDLQQGGLPAVEADVEDTSPPLAQASEDDAAAGQSAFDDSDAVQVGSLRVLNAVPLLEGIQAWHGSFRDDLDFADLGVESGCWFGRLGDAAVQVVHCGPVGEVDEDSADDGEYRFDLIPVTFEAAPGGSIGTAMFNDTIADVVVANALIFVGAPGGVEPPS